MLKIICLVYNAKKKPHKLQKQYVFAYKLVVFLLNYPLGGWQLTLMAIRSFCCLPIFYLSVKY